MTSWSQSLEVAIARVSWTMIVWIQELTEWSTSCQELLLALCWTGSGDSTSETDWNFPNVLQWVTTNPHSPRYRILMPTVAGCLCALLLATYWVAKVSSWLIGFFVYIRHSSCSPIHSQVSFPGLVTCIWLIYAFSFCHFSTVPAQVFSSSEKHRSPFTLFRQLGCSGIHWIVWLWEP